MIAKECLVMERAKAKDGNRQKIDQRKLLEKECRESWTRVSIDLARVALELQKSSPGVDPIQTLRFASKWLEAGC